MKIDSLKYNGKSIRKIYQGDELVKKINYGQPKRLAVRLEYTDGEVIEVPFVDGQTGLMLDGSGIQYAQWVGTNKIDIDTSRVKSIAVGEGITSMGQYAFSFPFEYLQLPSTLASFGINAFNIAGNKAIQHLVYNRMTPPTMGLTLAYSRKVITNLYLPDGNTFASDTSTYRLIRMAQNIITPIEAYTGQTITMEKSTDVFQYIKNDGDTPTPPAPVPYEEQYFTIETLTTGDLSLADADSKVFNYSLDNGSTWNTLATGQTVAVEANKKVLFKAQELTANMGQGIGTIKYTGNFNVYGNVMSLVYGDNFINQETMDNFQFLSLFAFNATLISAENLVLPATTLANGCYYNMFYGCTSLTTAPELPATTLANGCYAWMFYKCTSLNYIKCLATNISASDCTLGWVNNVSSTGTFVKAASMNDWTIGENGIPNGWTVVNA